MASNGSSEGRGQAPAVDRAARILTLFAERPGIELGVSEISRNLQLNKSTTHSILTSLSSSGFLERDPGSRRYRPGPVLYAVADALRRGSTVTTVARPALETLLREFGETVFLAVFEDDHVILVDKAESTLDLSITSPLGRRLPHSAGALGKVFHAFMPQETLRPLLRRRPLRRFTDRTMVDRAAYVRELRRVRETRISFDDEEYLEGVRGVAAPIFDARGDVAAAVCVVGPSARLNPRDLARIGERTCEVARSASTRLGGGGAWEQEAITS